MKFVKLLMITLLFSVMLTGISSADQYDDAVAAFGNEDYVKAAEIFEVLAKENNLAAKTLLGSMYFKGQGVEQDINKGLAMIMDAASQGNAQAKTVAAALNREIAILGDPTAMYNVGYMCFKGWGGDQDPNMCVQWLEKAAEGGHLKSAKVLAQIYKEGKYGIAPDEEKASLYSSMIQQ